MTHSEILLPAGCNPKLSDRSTLWNTVEAAESRHDAQLCRSVTMALPHELGHKQRLEITRKFVQKHFVDRGMIADFALHDPDPKKGENPLNFHAHVLLTLRKGMPAGLHRVKTREWNSRALINEWRSDWCAMQNSALKRGGFSARVDHRSFAARLSEAKTNNDRQGILENSWLPEQDIGHRAWSQSKTSPSVVNSRSRPAGLSAASAHARFQKLKEISQTNRGTLRQIRTLWERRASLVMQRQQFYERVLAGYELGKVSHFHAKMRIHQVAMIRGEIDQVMQSISAAQQSLDGRQKVFERAQKVLTRDAALKAQKASQEWPGRPRSRKVL